MAEIVSAAKNSTTMFPTATSLTLANGTVISAASKTTWFNTVFTTASLCGTYSLAERRADTCFGLTIVQVVYFLAESAPCGEQLKRMLLRQYVPSRLAHLADVKLGTYFNVAVVLMLVSLVIMAVALVVTDIMNGLVHKI